MILALTRLTTLKFVYHLAASLSTSVKSIILDGEICAVVGHFDNGMAITGYNR